MLGFVFPSRLLPVLLCTLVLPLSGGGQASDGGTSSTHSATSLKTETFVYSVEWRLINAGVATLKLTSGGTAQFPSLHSELTLVSAGLVSKLYKVNDRYLGNYDSGYCASSVHMTSEEGRRRRDTRVTYDRSRKKAVYLERDAVKNSTVHAGEIDIPACVHDVLGALLRLRAMNLDPGQSAEIPVSDGKKFAPVRVEAQERESVKIDGEARKTVRYEAFLMNGVIYPRKARLFVWLTDDARKIPVQFRLRMNFPIGTVTLTLDKLEL